MTYTYDSLNRLIRAETADTSWGNAYSYDGFGNLTAKTVTKGSAPAFSATYDPATNRMMGGSYDANGNDLSGGAVYDAENHNVGGGWVYDPAGKRLWNQNTYTLYFYGLTGQRLSTFACSDGCYGLGTQGLNMYFGGRLVVSNGQMVATDRLGSVRANSGGERISYFPFGEERTSTANGREKFGTYFRDSTGVDYADQRYYSNVAGRFQTPDPYTTSSTPSVPQLWNRYTYVGGDPVNFKDPHGLFRCADCENDDDDDAPPDPFPPMSPRRQRRNPVQGPGGAFNSAAWTAIGAWTWTLRPILANELRQLPEQCWQAFAGINVTQAAMMNGALNTFNFIDSTGAAGNLTMQTLYAPYGNIGQAGNQTVRDYGAAQAADGFTTAVTLTFTPNGGATVWLPDIVLTPLFFAPPQVGVDPMLVLVHEALHFVSQRGDQSLVNSLGIPQGGDETASHALSAWLANGCGGQR